jgi:hypothetical protein
MQLRKSNHKFFWKEFEHPLDGPKGEIQRTPRGTYLIKRSRSPTMFFIQLFVGFRPLFAPRFKHFKLVNHTSLMIGTRLPRNNLDFSTKGAPARCFNIVLPSAFHGGRLSSCSTGEAVLLMNPVSPYKISK